MEETRVGPEGSTHGSSERSPPRRRRRRGLHGAPFRRRGSCTRERSAPESTALACFSASTSPARASLRSSKFLSNQSHETWRSPKTFDVAVYSPVLLFLLPSAA